MKRFRFPQLLATIAIFSLILACGYESALGQTLPRKLPSAEKIIDNYLKAIGGKKAVAGIRDTTYDFTIQVNDQPFGTARVQTKIPASERWEMTFGNGQIISATNSGSAWERGLNGQLRTLTGAEAAAAKLRGVLSASRLLNIRKSNVLARVISVGDLGSEPAYIVEFSTRSGARLQYYFSVKTGLITKITDDARKNRIFFEDYKRNKGVLEPNRVRLSLDSGEIALHLQTVAYDTGVAKGIFDPPAASETLDVVSLLREVGRNQNELEQRVSEYAFRQKETDREINSKGEIKKETTKVYEVFPIPNREPVLKLISENGVELSGERAAREGKRVLEELEKAEREREKDKREAERKKAEQAKKQEAKKDEEDPGISQFLRACEFVSPRREQFNGREAVVFDFRPRPGFRPTNRSESLIAKLVGVVWIDPLDKQVMRLEARLAEGFKIGGGLLVSLKPGAAMVMEQTRMNEGVWLPRLAQVNLSIKILLFGGGDLNKTLEWSDYRHFSGDVKDYKLDSPKTDDSKKP
ncbi:MAG TPA: hypothetical protein VLA93_12015 [Pyrinomonadaceae bacterium]|nr:hypothetical protein [Pyrinomonadaceae bacterium]